MKTLRLTAGQEQLLHEQTIDAEHPGPVLRDFAILLDYVGTEGVPAAGKYNLLPIEAIPKLDPLLSRPLRLNLKRPQLRSHPYLQGLHLLFRASGLGRVEATGDKARLVVDPQVLESWNRLNPTEQYFNLLEAWFLNGRPEMLGDRGGLWSRFLSDCLSCWQNVPAKGYKVNLKPAQYAYLPGIGRDFFHAALLDLFGLLRVDHPRQPVTPWCPTGLGHLPFGDAVFTLLAGQLFASYEGVLWRDDSDEEDEAEASFGRWQPIFQPYFPDWRENLTFPEEESRSGVFVFRVSLGKRVWRRLAIPADFSLDDLLNSILHAFDFDFDHLYEFEYRDRFGASAKALDPRMDEGPAADQVRIGDLPLKPGQSMKLTYDFGDNWQFDVKLESVGPPDKKLKKPRLLESHGESPAQYPDAEDW